MSILALDFEQMKAYRNIGLSHGYSYIFACRLAELVFSATLGESAA